MRRFFLGVASLLLLSANVYAQGKEAKIGYCLNLEKINRNGQYKVGNSLTQGQAIRLPKAKLQHMIGKNITKADFILATRNTLNNKIHAFITTSLGGTPIAEGDITIGKSFEACTWTLPTPYTITGEEENLYIGYTTETIKDTYKPLMGDLSYDLKGYTYAFKDSTWVDTYGQGKGSALINAYVNDVDDFSDVVMGTLNYNKYYKAGEKYEFAARMVNVGTKPITSFDAEVTVDGKKTSETFSNVSIPAKSSYTFILPNVSAQSDGQKEININITNINGNNEDIDASDNVDNGELYFYPSYMERSLLVESTTGQDCPNCPTGHRNLKAVLGNYDESFVEVTHHIGYYPDIFTMDEDQTTLFYYGSQTYAPAAMVNRTVDYNTSTVPIVDISSNTTAIKSTLDNALTYKPYVSLNLDTKFNEATRELTVKLGIKPHEQLPSDVLFNVYLVQDSLVAYQSNGGTNYKHNNVFRGTVTGNSWGMLLPNIEVGTSYDWEKTITLPDSIHSSYWTDDMITEVNGKQYYEGKYLVSQTNIETVPKNMRVVAFVSEYNSNDNAKNKVFNCTEATLGGSHMQYGYDYIAGIEAAEEQPNVGIYVTDGKVGVSGNYDKIYVYSITGKMVDASSRLGKGMYIVKVLTNGKQTTKKILVR